MIRILLMLLLLSALNIRADAFTVKGDVNSLSVYFQQTIDSRKQLLNADTNRSARKNATPVIMLDVLPYQGRIAQISWQTSDYSIPGTYYVERLNPSGWIVIKQLSFDAVLEYTDTISSPFCTATAISYRIRFISNIDNTTSPEASVLLYDQTPPADVTDLNVDLGFNNNVLNPLLTWNDYTSDSISRYIVQRWDGFAWAKIDSVIVNNNVPSGAISFYDKTGVPACGNTFKYIILTYDMCGNPSAPDYDEFVQTLKLDVAHPDQCDKSAELTWNAYDNIPGGLNTYAVYRSEGLKAPELIWETQDLFYTDNFDFQNDSTYTYSVKAISNNVSYTSSSCMLGQKYSGAILPDTVYISQVSVEDDSYIRIDYYFTPPESVVKLILERSDDNMVSFHAIDSLPVSVGIVPEISYFNDTTADVHSQSYYYRLVAIDDCGYKKLSINVSRSIWLQCAGSTIQNTLGWNSYEYWLQGVNEYEVYRIVAGQSSTIEMIGSEPDATLSFPDLLTDFDHSKPVCYWIEAAENPLNPYLSDAISKSNTCCIIKDPVLFMPNAFYPDGVNKLFRPVPDPIYVDMQSFKMTVFNRWGQQIFETNDMATGWDGTVNGEGTPAGLYSYILKYKSYIGEEYVKRGTVTLLR